MTDMLSLPQAGRYAAFLASKKPRALATGIEPGYLRPALFDFQRHCVEFALRQGRAGLYLTTGLGKSLCQLEWCDHAMRAGNGFALLLTPLAVARQIEREAHKHGYDARVIRDQSEARAGINICNYDRLDKLDCDAFGAVSLDEASVLKSYTGKTTRALINAFAGHRFKMAATATPAPNDHMELGQQAEFLSIMPSNEMLMRWFITDQTEMGRYRLKGHAEGDFYDWMASWARMARSPEDLGFDGTRFVLPPLKIVRHRARYGEVRPIEGSLFTLDTSATAIHDIKRQTAGNRADKAAELAANGETWLIWVDTDYESAAVKARIPDAVEVRGSMTIEQKEEALDAFSTGSARILLTKPSIAGQGMNFQNCARQVFVGRSFSYESWFQAVRRCWRFGQKREVEAHIIVAEGEDQIGRVIDRKAADHDRLDRAMAEAMGRSMVTEKASRLVDYQPKHEGRVPAWLRSAA